MRCCPYRIDKPAFEIPADRNEVIHKRANCFSQQIIFAVFAMQVEHIPSVFAMHPCSRSRKDGNHLAFHGSQITRMHDVRLQAPECPEKIDIKLEIMSVALVQRDNLHVLARDPAPEVRIPLQTNYGMPVAIGRNMIDEVDYAIFQPSHSQMINHVSNERGLLDMFQRI